MPYETKELGAAGNVLRYRLRYHQRTRSRSFTALARTMRELGHPMTAARIGEAFNGYRRIATDELTALATALEVPAGSLVLAASPSVDVLLVERIGSETSHDLRVRLARVEFSIADLEAGLERGVVLSHRERRDSGVPAPEESLAHLESACIEVELIESELRRREAKEANNGKR
ncbi:MAG: hypothetical protein H7288_19530 [Kineosporiaceae bacterium]|nr:hypothetical protein [Aeromicrobium sp.]